VNKGAKPSVRPSAEPILRRVGRDASGAVMLEFAFVVIPFIALILASLYTSLIFFTSQALESSVQRAARQIATGSAQKAGTTQAQYKTAICASLPGYMKCNRLFVEVRRATSFASLDLSAPAPTINAAGEVTNSGDYQTVATSERGMVRLSYVWYAGSGPNNLNLSNRADGNRVLVATSVFMAEPYGS
jgi:Flp pilus assembly protein TadG